ncbi:MAG: hypothetical protein H6657_27435 [Ardenticatenaceae bacterium]|nr:hypothetical protein [Ardenticatenaceae bacterium]
MDDFSDNGGRRSGRSLFGPIVLIGLGVYFLLRNMGIVSDLNWGVAFQLWPLLLIFLGINIIVQQVRRPLGTILSGLVGLTAVALFGAVLLFGVELPFLSRFNLQTTAEYREETISVSAEDVATAVVTLDLGSLGADVTGLDSNKNVLEGTLNIAGDLQFEQRMRGSEAIISLGENNSGLWFGDWIASGNPPPWQIGLSRTVPLDLTVDVGSGQADLELGSLLLSDLVIDVGSGAVDAELPGGSYDVRVDGGSGRLTMTLPSIGFHEVEIDGGSGAMSLMLPPNMEARVELDSGSGHVSMDARFERVSGDEDSGVWQTPGYDAEGNNSILIVLDGGSGSISIEPQTGR